MQWETLHVERLGAVVRIRLNRPEMRNAINARMRRDLLEAAQWVDADDAVRVVILAASGPVFCAGADLVEAQAGGFSVIRVVTEQYKPALLSIYRSPKTWVSAVQGAAAGIGVALVQVCDLSIMSEDSSLYLAFEGISLIPDGGITALLEKGLGRKRCFQLIAERGRLTAGQCLAFGLCNRVVAATELDEAAAAWAQSLSERAPMTLRYAKAALNASAVPDLEAAMDAEAMYQSVCASSGDAQEGIAAFLEKRPARWQGR